MYSSGRSEQHHVDPDHGRRELVGGDLEAEAEAAPAEEVRVVVPWCCVLGHAVSLRRCMTVWIFGGAPGCF